MDLYTIFLSLIGVEIILESQELQSSTHLGKEVQDSKGASICPFIFVLTGYLKLREKRLIVLKESAREIGKQLLDL